MAPLLCPSCSTTIDADQRYCLDCGRPCSLESERLLVLAAGRAKPAEPTEPPKTPVADPSPVSRRRTAMSLVLGLIGVVLLAGTGLGGASAQSYAAAFNPGLTVNYPASLFAVAQTVVEPPAQDTPPSDDVVAPDDTSSDLLATDTPLDETPAETTPPPADTETTTTPATGTPEEEPPPIKHVFVIVMSGQNLVADAADPTSAPYLSGTLAPKGTLLTGYYAVAHGALPNGIALVSGQGPTPETQAGCPTYTDMAPATVGDDGQEQGTGCVYSVQSGTIGDQLRGSELTARTYVDGVVTAATRGVSGRRATDTTTTTTTTPSTTTPTDTTTTPTDTSTTPAPIPTDTTTPPADAAPPETTPAPAPDPTPAPPAPSDPAATPAPVPPPTTGCRHPDVGAADPHQAAVPGDAVVTWRNPFLYFHTTIDGTTCAADNVGLDRLDADVALGEQAPAVSYVVPDRCHDGSADPCAPGAPAGTVAGDAWLSTVVPKILTSKAYADGGLLVVTSDEAPAADATGCCRPTAFPNTPNPGGAASDPATSGGGLVGALLVSPYVSAGKTVATKTSHFALLRTIEDVFKLQSLGYAGASFTHSLIPKVVSRTEVSR